MFKPAYLRLFVFSILLLALYPVQNLLAQIEVAPKRGVYLNSSYSGDFETINNTNGNVMFNLPLASLPAGRGGMSYGITLSYNSKLFDVQTNALFVPPPGYVGQVMIAKKGETSGWRYGVGYQFEQKKRPGVPEFQINHQELCHSPANPNYKYFDMYKFVMTMADGSEKEFTPVINFGGGLYDSENQDGYHSVDINGKYRRWTDIYVLGEWRGCEISYHQYTGTMTFYTTDGSFLRLDIAHDADTNPANNAWTLTTPDGSRITQAAPLPNEINARQKIYDRNNNYVEIQKPNPTADTEIVQVTDQLGRNLTINKNLQTFEDVITVKGVDNATLNWIVKWKNIGVSRQFWMSEDRAIAPQPSTATGVFKVIDEIVLPAQLGGQSYKFDYHGNPNGDLNTASHGFGEVSRVEMPSGAVTEYTYKLNGTPAVPEWKEVFLNSITTKKLIYQVEYDGQPPSTKEENWIYDITRTESTITAPGGGISKTFYNDWFEDSAGFAEHGGIVGSSQMPDGTTNVKQQIWQNGSPSRPWDRFWTSLVETEYTTIPDSAGNPLLAAIKTYNYDLNGNIVRIKEYDWVAHSSLTFSNGKLIIPSAAELKRVTENTYYNSTPEYDPNLAYNQGENSPNTYYNVGSARILNAIKSTEIKTGSGMPVARSEFFYDDLVIKGNLTETKVWDSTKQAALPNADANGYRLNTANSISTLAQYNPYGSPNLMTDAEGVQTAITYGNVSSPTGDVTELYPTKVETASNTPLKRTSTMNYDFYTGLATSATDVDNNLTSGTDYDALGRPIKVKAAVGTPLEVWTQTEYDDANRRVITRSDLFVKGDAKKVATQFYDQLGRVRLSKTLEDAATQSATNETDGIKVQTRYSPSGACTYDASKTCSFQLVSNPYRASTSSAASSEPSMGWTRSQTVNTGKHSETETFAGASLPAPWGTNANSSGKVQSDADANTKTVTDQAGKKRKGISDALGRMIQVVEDPTGQNLSTDYVFDTLGNLRKTVQGEQSRYFMYDSLGRLLYAKQPEQDANASFSATDPVTSNTQWSVKYVYDNNGNIASTTDARNVSVTGTYDALNRLTLRDYSDATADVTFTYDDPAIAFSKGKMTKVSSSVSETRYASFDNLGRTLTSQQITDGQTYNFGYSYNLSGALVEETYPSGRVVKNVLDNDGDLSIVQSKKNSTQGFFNYAKNFAYNAAGAVEKMQLGNGRWETASYNNRLQVTQIGLGLTDATQNLLKLEYAYGTASENNGSLREQKMTVPTELIKALRQHRLTLTTISIVCNPPLKRFPAFKRGNRLSVMTATATEHSTRQITTRRL